MLFALNTTDARLAIFEIREAGLTLAAEVPVGLEPVSVAVRSTAAGNVQAWVVNHLSDSVSVVHVQSDDLRRSRVVATLLVGDEPHDVVFAGTRRDRAFVTSARRGQNLPITTPPLLSTPGVGRALVWVFDADAEPSVLGGTPLAVLELFGDTPRALAASPDGRLVHAAIFQSGNQTTLLPGWTVAHHGGLPLPPVDSPYFDPAYDPSDELPDLFRPHSLIVGYDGATGAWQDELGRNWAAFVRLSLPDYDVFTIDADETPPALLPDRAVSGVGTVLYGMAVNPADGKIFVTNTEARNRVRFEPLIDATHGLNGHVVENRVTVIDGTTVLPVHLNPHIDYARPTGPAEEIAQSIGLPLDPTFSGDGTRLYVAGFGSARVGIFSVADLEAGRVSRTLVDVGGGPMGLALDEARDRLYVLNRFEHSISIVEKARDLDAARETTTVALRFDPSPRAVRRGRRFLYDTRLSGHGDSACASCHVFGDLDAIAWDLGDPYGPILPNPNFAGAPVWHPMKGPMVTQSLRGMKDAGPMHWRGDRTGAGDAGGDTLDEEAAFRKFNPAFRSLLGGSRELTSTEMQEFTDFALTLRYPPHPERRLDDQMTAGQTRGREIFRKSCEICHNGKLGTPGFSLSILDSEGFKIPHLRSIYQKVGMFAQPPNGFEETGRTFPASPFLGPQIRGFGYFNDGILANAVNALPGASDPANLATRTDLEAFLFVFPTGLAPAVGQQLSATPATVADPMTVARRDLLLARATAGDCDLVVTGLIRGEPRGAVHIGGDRFVTDRAAEPTMTVAELWADAGIAGHEQTYTCVPPGSGVRAGVDRDEDGVADGDEVGAGTSPVDPLSYPGGVPVVNVPTAFLTLQDDVAHPGSSRRRLRLRVVTSEKNAANRIVPPAPGSAGDPTVTGATLHVYNTAGSGEAVEVPLPASGWTASGRGYRFRSPGALTSIRILPDRLTIRAGATAMPYSLDEPAQRRIGARLVVGSTVQWCAEAPARLGASGPVDRVDLFKSRRRAPAPGECPALPR